MVVAGIASASSNTLDGLRFNWRVNYELIHMHADFKIVLDCYKCTYRRGMPRRKNRLLSLQPMRESIARERCIFVTNANQQDACQRFVRW